jgi:hypothetical protein
MRIKPYKEIVHNQLKYDYDTCVVLQTLKNIHPKYRSLINDGLTTTLTVTVPQNPRHSFWQQEVVPLESPECQDEVSFEVHRWGQTKEASVTYFNLVPSYVACGGSLMKHFLVIRKKSAPGASRLLQAIQEKLDSHVYIYSRPVLQYYKVQFPDLSFG